MGGPERAVTRTPGSALDETTTAYAPVSRFVAFCTARKRSPSKFASTSCANTSVSVSLENLWPAAASSAFRSEKFSKMPLCATTMRPPQSVCGWAFSSVGRPCVAQRVWAIPVRPLGIDVSLSTRFPSLPGARWISNEPFESVAMPAES